MPEPDHPQPWILHLPGHGVSLTVPGDQTLLQAMQKAAIPWPASCRNGTCRICIGQLASGAVRYGIEWPGLLPEEKNGGAVLPCVAFATSDVTLAPPLD